MNQKSKDESLNNSSDDTKDQLNDSGVDALTQTIEKLQYSSRTIQSTKFNSSFDSLNGSQTKEKENTWLGIFWCTAFGLITGGMFISQKISQKLVPGINALHMAFFRQMFIALGSYLYCRFKGQSHQTMGLQNFFCYNKETRVTLMYRCILGWGVGTLFMVAVMLMPVSVFVALSRVSVLMTPILAYLLLGEKVCYQEIIMIIGGFMGVLTLTNPDWFTPEVKGSELYNRDQQEGKKYPYQNLGIVVTIIAAIVCSLDTIVLRKLNDIRKTPVAVPTCMQTFYYGVSSFLGISIIALLYAPELFDLGAIYNGTYIVKKQELICYIVIGFFAWLSVELTPIALKSVKSSLFMAFYNLPLVMSFMVDMFDFNRVEFFSDYIGSAMIICFTIFQSLASQNQVMKNDSYQNKEQMNSMEYEDEETQFLI